MSPMQRPLSPAEEHELDALLSGDSAESDLRAFLGEAKAALRRDSDAELSAIAEGSLVGRVLANTTRLDLSWRGELRLLTGFVRERLHSSVALRVVAASLILHLAALPALALWMGARAQKAPVQISFEPAESLPNVIDELPLAESAGPEAPGDGPAIYGAREADNALRRARYVLSRAAGPGLPEPQPQDSLERNLLLGRSGFLRDRSWQTWWNESERWSTASALARVLWVELLLDAYVLENRSGTLLGLALAELEAAAAGPASAPAQRELRRMVLQRAYAYGLRPWPTAPGPNNVPEPLSSGWLQALQAVPAPADFQSLLGSRAFGGWIGD